MKIFIYLFLIFTLDQNFDTYIYSVGFRGFLSYDDGSNSEPIRIRPIEVFTENRSMSGAGKFRIKFLDESDNVIITLKRRNQVMDTSRSDKYIISYEYHGDSNQKYKIRMTGDKQFKILQDENCMEYDEDKRKLYVDGMKCLDENDKNYKFQVFEFIKVDDVENERIRSILDGELPIWEDDFPNRRNDRRSDSRRIRSPNEDRNRDRDWDRNPNRNRDRNPDRNWDREDDIFDNRDKNREDDRAFHCRQCRRLQNNRRNGNFGSNLIQRQGDNSSDQPVAYNMSMDTEKEQNKMHETKPDSERYNSTANQKSYLDSKNKKSKFSSEKNVSKNKKKFEGEENGSNEEKQSIYKIDIHNASDDSNIEKQPRNNINAIDSSKTKTMSYGCNNNKPDSFNPICTEEINRKVREISEMIPSTLTI